MRRSLFALAATSVFVAGVGLASAQTTTTTTASTWTNDQGPAITQYSTTQHYSSFSDPSLKPNVGMELPGTVHAVPAARHGESS